jgi:hypothetical protein
MTEPVSSSPGTRPSRAFRAAPLGLMVAGAAAAGAPPSPPSPPSAAAADVAPRHVPIPMSRLLRGIAVAVDGNGQAHVVCVEPGRSQQSLVRELQAAETVDGHPLAYQ